MRSSPRNDSLFGHRSLGSVFSDGAPLTNATPVSLNAATGSAKSGSLRWLSTCAGSLAVAYLRPNGTAYPTGQPASVPVTANVEAVVALTPAGLSQLRVTFTPSANGSVTHADLILTD